jgi:DNA polymerase-3 subunit epsilon
MPKDVLVTVVDVETTGLDVKTDKVTEVGMALWNATKNKVLKVYGSLVSLPDVEIDPLITELTGITTEDVRAPHAITAAAMCDHILEFNSYSDYFMAHNAVFDYSMLLAMGAGREEYEIALKFTPWIDSRTDTPYPKGKKKSSSLTYLAADHGFLNPFPHRAVFDAVATAKLVGMYSFEDVLKRANSPIIELVANVEFNDRHLPKGAGFYWNPDRKKWFKALCECDFDKAELDFPYEVVRIKPEYPRASMKAEAI